VNTTNQNAKNLNIVMIPVKVMMRIIEMKMEIIHMNLIVKVILKTTERKFKSSKKIIQLLLLFEIMEAMVKRRILVFQIHQYVLTKHFRTAAVTTARDGRF
jgi:hypothetical protein